MSLEYTTHVTDLDELDDHPRNYRTHPADQLEHIKESLRSHGFYKNIIASQDGYILGGHGVSKATRQLEGTLADRIAEAREAGHDETAQMLEIVNEGAVPVRQIDADHDEPAALKVLAGDNEIRHVGMQNDTKLTQLLEEIQQSQSEDLTGTGFDDQRLATLEMVSRPPEEVTEVDHDAHWQGMPEYEGEGDQRFKIIVSFRDQDDQEEFIDQTDHLIDVEKRGKQTESCWYPPKEINDRQSIRFEPESQSQPESHGDSTDTGDSIEADEEAA